MTRFGIFSLVLFGGNVTCSQFYEESFAAAFCTGLAHSGHVYWCPNNFRVHVSISSELIIMFRMEFISILLFYATDFIVINYKEQEIMSKTILALEKLEIENSLSVWICYNLIIEFKMIII